MAPSLPFDQLITQIAEGGTRPIIIVLGNGLLGEAFVNKAVRDCAGHVIWYARDYNKLLGQQRDIIQGAAALGVNSQIPSAKVGEDLEVVSRIVGRPNTSREQYKSFAFTNRSVDNPLTMAFVALGDMELLKKVMPIGDIVYYTLGMSEHRSGERERSNLLSVNAGIVADYAHILREGERALHIVVSNPDNIIAKVYAELTGLYSRKVVTAGSTLDTIRFRSEIANAFGVSPQVVSSAAVFGNHGIGMEFLWDSVTIGGVPFYNKVAEIIKTYGTDIGSTDEIISRLKVEVEQKVLFSGRDIVEATHRGTAFGPEAAVELVARSVVKKMAAIRDGRKVDIEIVCGLEILDGAYGISGKPFLGNLGRVTSNEEHGFMIDFVECALSDASKQRLSAVATRLQTGYNEIIDTARSRMNGRGARGAGSGSEEIQII